VAVPSFVAGGLGQSKGEFESGGRLGAEERLDYFGGEVCTAREQADDWGAGSMRRFF
jgi:hypothetical protein